MKNKNQLIKSKQNGFGWMPFFMILLVFVGVFGYVVVKEAQNAKNDLVENASIASKNAANDYFKSSSPTNNPNGANTTAANTSQPKPTQEQQQIAQQVANNASKQIAGNSIPTVQPILSPNVPIPRTSIDSIRTFFKAIQNGDFLTANSLMGAKLAQAMTELSGSSNPNTSLSACLNNKTCKLVLYSFQPPQNGYTTRSYVSQNNTRGEQISFPLSKSNPVLAQSIGNYNVDIFSEEYAGNVWVIQNVYVNGQPLNDFL